MKAARVPSAKMHRAVLILCSNLVMPGSFRIGYCMGLQEAQLEGRRQRLKRYEDYLKGSSSAADPERDEINDLLNRYNWHPLCSTISSGRTRVSITNTEPTR